jgi:hypothetical protein
MKTPNHIDLTSPIFANTPEATELLQLTEKVAELETFAAGLHIGHWSGLKGALEALHNRIELMKQQLHDYVTKGAE